MEKEQKTIKYRNRFNFWFKRFINWIKGILFRLSVYHRTGSHIITGYPGAGKTLLMNKLINQVNNKKYFFITNIDEFNQENVIQYEVFNLFEKGKQIAKLPIRDYKGRKLYGLILDEINLKYNRRLNNTRGYNDSFVGLIELIITHRHQGIPRVYFIGQKLELQDSQLQSLFKYWHNIIYNRIKAIWKYFKLEGKLIYAPTRLYIENYIKGYGDEYIQADELSEIEITYEDLKSYDTYGLAKIYSELPTILSIPQQIALKEKNNK